MRFVFAWRTWTFTRPSRSRSAARHAAAAARSRDRSRGTGDLAMPQHRFRRTQAHAQHLRRFVHFGLGRLAMLRFVVLPIHVELLSRIRTALEAKCPRCLLRAAGPNAN